VAFALQSDGWYLRSDIIWHKSNPMPESVRDRPTKSHEYMFLLSKSPRYYFDADAVREPHKTNLPVAEKGRSRDRHAYDSALQDREKDGWGSLPSNPAGRNIRSVWSIPTRPYKGAHFATMPPRLVEPCVKAGSSEKGCCPTCGKPWERETAIVGQVKQKWGQGSETANHRIAGGGVIGKLDRGLRDGMVNVRETTGWRPGCECPAHDPIPCTVLDPFNGSGTTGVVAEALGRDYVGLDLSADYLAMAKDRIARPHKKIVRAGKAEHMPLFAGEVE
jgi:hypothetical protein